MSNEFQPNEQFNQLEQFKQRREELLNKLAEVSLGDVGIEA